MIVATSGNLVYVVGSWIGGNPNLPRAGKWITRDEYDAQCESLQNLWNSLT